jgi:HSP20 family protein
MFLMPVSRSLVARPNVWRAFDRLLDDGFLSTAGATPSRAPALDVSETETAYVATLDLPGVSKEQVKVSIEGKRVRIEAEAKSEEEKKAGDQVIYRERSVSSFARSFTLPVAVDEAGSQAELKNGVLTLTLAKKADVVAKQLTVN